MGDRYELIKDCVYCGKTDDRIWYAPTSGFLTFKCDKCKKENFITSDFEVKKIEEVTYEEVYDTLAFTSTMMDEKQIKDYAKQLFKQLKKQDEFQEIVSEKLKKIKDGK